MIRCRSLISVFLLYSSLSAVTTITLDEKETVELNSLPSTVLVWCDLASIGNKVSLEMFHDINRNGRIDVAEPRVYFFYLVDGLGTISDGQSTNDAITGDETPPDGVIQATLQFDNQWNPGCRQRWLVKVTDEDLSTAYASIEWNLPEGNSGIFGKVIDASTGRPLPDVVVNLIGETAPESRFRAVTDGEGQYSITLPSGEYFVSLSFPRGSLFQFRTERVRVLRNYSELNFSCRTFSTFFSAKAYFADGMPVCGIAVVLQKKDDGQFFQGLTDENGEVSIGIEPGDYFVNVNQVYDRHFGESRWPSGCFPKPESELIRARKGETVTRNFLFSRYPKLIRGTCTYNGRPAADVLIQAIGADSDGLAQKIYQTFSKADGSYILGVDSGPLITLFAQKDGSYSMIGKAGEVKLTEDDLLCNFNFDAGTSLMSLKGKVLDEQGKPVVGAWVAARHAWENSPSAHLLTRTDAMGEYLLDVTLEGDWRIGVFTQAQSASPSMYFRYVTKGIRYENLNFLLNKDTVFLARSEKSLELSKPYLMPRMFTSHSNTVEIDFFLPRAGYTQVDVLTLDGKELVKLIESQLSKGFQQIVWDGRDENGRPIAQGVYLCRVKTSDQTSTNPITLK